MARRETWQLQGGFWATSLGTLAGRVLGLVRDMATASLLGLGEGGVMDALVVAFRVPNLARRIFGEGALAASFLPVFASQYEREPRRAWQLLSVLLAWLAMALTALVLAAEAVFAGYFWLGGSSAALSQLVGLSAALLPYLIFICLAAQASAALQARLEFRVPAVAPLLLNVCWLAAVWGIAPWLAPDKLAQAYALAAGVLVSGVLQFGVQLPALRRLGFRFDYDWTTSRDAFWLVVRSMAPIGLGMAVTQLNTLADSLLAWGLSANAGAEHTISWLPGGLAYPMQTGAAAAIYYGERFYQLPVGILGLAIATVIYPLLSRHAARGDRAALAADLTLGLRLVAFTALPAGIGIMLVAHPAARVLFERGAFTADDATRAARMIAGYASGVWAYSAIPILVRGYYAVGNRMAPARVGLLVVAINLTLNLALVWPLAELGLAVSTSIAAGIQVILLAATFSRGAGRLAWRELGATLAKSAASAVFMGAAVLLVQQAIAVDGASPRTRVALQLATSIVAGIGAYLAAARLLGMREPGLLLARPTGGDDRS